MLQQCRHFQTNGSRCRQVALSDGPLCYYHRHRQPRRRRSLTQAQTRTQTHSANQTLDYGAIPVSEPEPLVDIIFPEDRASIQINLHSVLLALAHNRIDIRTANAMTWNIHASMTNLAHKPLLETEPAKSTQSRSTNEDSEGPTSGFSDVTSRPAIHTVQRIILTPDGDEIAPPTA